MGGPDPAKPVGGKGREPFPETDSAPPDHLHLARGSKHPVATRRPEGATRPQLELEASQRGAQDPLHLEQREGRAQAAKGAAAEGNELVGRFSLAEEPLGPKGVRLWIEVGARVQEAR